MNNLVVFADPLFESTPVLRCNWSITFSRRRYTISNENVEQRLSLARLGDIRKDTFQVWAICRLFHLVTKVLQYSVYSKFLYIFNNPCQFTCRQEGAAVIPAAVSCLNFGQNPRCQTSIDSMIQNFLDFFFKNDIINHE